MVKINNKKHITKQGIIKKNPQKAEIGDGKSPNKYWVHWSNDFYICKDGTCDWASDTKKFKVKGGSAKKSFNTFQEALEYLEGLYISGEPDVEGICGAYINDRYSGQIYEVSLHAYPVKDIMGTSYKYEIETYSDLGYTKKEMVKRGEIFR